MSVWPKTRNGNDSDSGGTIKWYLVIPDEKHTFCTGTGSGLGVADALKGGGKKEKGKKKTINFCKHLINGIFITIELNILNNQN